MVETKDKVVTVESLKAFHEYNKREYISTDNPTATGTMVMNGDMSVSGDITLTQGAMNLSNIQFVPTGEGFNIVFLEEETVEEETTEETVEEETTEETVEEETTEEIIEE